MPGPRPLDDGEADPAVTIPGELLEDPASGATEFTSDDPNASIEEVNNRDGAEGAAGEPAADADDGGGEAERAIEEADILKVEGDTLFALSQYRGLVTIDVSDPQDLQLMGRYASEGIPFEMYVRDGVAYALYSSFWGYEQDEATGRVVWRQTSRVLAVDVSNPLQPFEIGGFDIPGGISDSRIVGDILYVVSYENGWCWGCNEGEPRTTVTSLSVADPANMEVVDQLAFVEDGQSWGWRRSIHVNTQRMYVSGLTWGGDWDNSHSTIQIVDISDPDGDMELGASRPVAGQIRSRWQMNEHDGALRVISQPGVWRGEAPPVIETFEVVSADVLEPLARVEMVLPRPEGLQSVRFDGDVGYAVTFERTDPLFIIDLSNPAEPEQRGELEIPGWLYHMEPRGDRLFGLGFDQQEETGLAISLFDVSDMDNPRQLSRVNFGARWGWMAEDQDRIHKAFKILEDDGLILMPYSGWDWSDEGGGRYDSGVQIIDFTRDSLTMRGAAPHKGRARRAFMHRDHLFAMSDDRVEAFDISDKDAPQSVSNLTLVRHVRRIVPVGDGIVAELVSDWWTEDARLDILRSNDPDNTKPLASVDLNALFDGPADANNRWNRQWRLYWGSRIAASGDHVFLMYGADNNVGSKLVSIDVTDPEHPTLGRPVDLPFATPYQYYGWWGGGQSATNFAVVDEALVVQAPAQWNQRRQESDPPTIEVIDISEPGRPQHVQSFPAGVAMYARGFDVAGSVIYTSRSEAIEGGQGRVRFFVDRIDVSDATEPEVLPPVNVPGTLAAIADDGRSIVTIDYRNFVEQVEDWQQCQHLSGGGWVRMDWQANLCVVGLTSINLLALDADAGVAELQERVDLGVRRLQTLHVSPHRALARFQQAGWWWGWAEADGADDDGDDGDDAQGNDDEPAVPDYRPEITVFSGLEEGHLTRGATARMHAIDGQVRAIAGDHAAVLSYSPPSLALYDLSDPDAPSIAREVRLRGYTQDMTIKNGVAYFANGPFGAQAVFIGGMIR